MSAEGVAKLRADIAASAASTKSLRVAARKLGGRRGMLMLQGSDDAPSQRARYLALALLTGRECRNVDRGLRLGLRLAHSPALEATWAAGEIVQRIASESFPASMVRRAVTLVRHWATHGDYAVGDICQASEQLVHRLEAERLDRVVVLEERALRNALSRLESARMSCRAACAARDKHAVRNPLTTTPSAVTVAPHQEVTR